MLNKGFFEEFGAKVSETLANGPAGDLEKNAKAVLGGVLSKMDLVTREEFDIQQEMLVRTREQLAALEARLAVLENGTAE
ncbi:MAG: accessory factor UbiK family protein [Neisseria sp.]|nr:accessory factor UbiK family protein [Neisseria sp.]